MADDTPSNSETTDGTAADAGPLEAAPGVPSEPIQVKPTDSESQLPNNEGPLAELPTYARGLLKIRVPVQVTLASQRKSIQEIIELGPGSIVRFDKTCDEPLDLTVGDRVIAIGEVVKVGDKFGLRIGGLVTT
jgi:flagellar motor switch protein FliN/FliY